MASRSVSNIKSDETVIFFRTSAWLNESSNIWHIPIHGWIYEPENSRVRKGIIATMFEQKYDLRTSKTTQANFDRRINLLIADNERGKRIVISIAGHQFRLPKSAPNGHFKKTIKLSMETVKTYAQNNALTFSAITKNSEKRTFGGEVMLVSPSGFSVISDIDDTIKISHVTDHKRLFDYTFFKDFEAAPGMSDLYRNLELSHLPKNNIAFHFVSSSPWHLYSPLLEFAEQSKFPKATFNLKYIRFKDSTFLNLFKKGTETKPKQIKPLLTRYPKRQFILIGDSGEQDPEVYARLLRKHPKQIIKILIRNVGNSSRNDDRFTKVFHGIDKNRWHLFNSTDEIIPRTLF